MKLLPAAMRWLSVCVLVACSTPVWSQNTSGLSARELFYTPPPAAQTPAAAAPSTPTSSASTDTKKATTSKPSVAKADTTKPASSSTSAQTATAQNHNSSAPSAGVPVVKVSNQPLGIRYTVMQEVSSGRYQGVNPSTTFHSGDRIRIQVESNQTGYLYVVTQGSSGGWQLLFPSAEVSNGDNQIARGQIRMVPPHNQFKFDEQEGTEKIFLVLSRQPEPDLDKLIYSIKSSAPADGAAPERMLLAKATINDDLVSRIRSQVIARDLVFETMPDDKSDDSKSNSAPAGDTATYVVNKSGSADSRLVVDLQLNHK